MNRLRNTAILTFLVMLIAGKAYGGDVNFTFTIPTIPFTPAIVSVSNSTIVAGQDSFSVFATIQGQEQMEACCDPSGGGGTGANSECTHECEPNCDFDCEISQYYGEVDPRVDPNPTCIPSDVDSTGAGDADCAGKSNPYVFYYYNGDPSTGGSQVMTYDSDTGSFTADVPISGYSEGDMVTWYFVVGDNMGNVTAQVPDPNVPPCTTLSSWSSDYETPAFNNCSLMNVYTGISGENCGVMVQGTPTCYSSNYTMNDPQNDTCGETQNPSPVALVDILGISAGSGAFDGLSGARVVCSKIKLGANPPDVGSSSGPIDAYVMVFFNPDIVDPNPNDVHMVNATAITYAPEASGADPNLVRVLWDGDCVTNPNTADPLSCKLIVGGGSEERLKVGAQGDELVFIAKNDLPNGDSILGSSSMMTRAIIATGDIQLEGDTPFWITDLTAGFAFVAKNQTGTLGAEGAPAAPLVVSPATCKWPDGTAYTTGKCSKSDTKPAKNTCELTINKSPDCGFAGTYKIYYNTTDNTSSATEVGTITSNMCGSNTFSYDIDAANLDGFPRYFYVSGVNTGGDKETDSAKWNKTTCTVEDWVEPSPPTSFACATPATQKNKCECTWVADTAADPSLTGFKVWRDTDLLTLNPWPAAIGQNNYSYTDTSESLVLGSSYTYKLKALDAGNNQSAEVTTSCTPEDLEDPSKVDSLGITLVPSSPEVNLKWTANETDTDVAGYNAYVCHEAIPGTSCNAAGDFTKLNTSLISGTLELPAASINETFTEEENYCFWVEACDNCDTAGNCPSNGGSPNCSDFDTIKNYRKCLTVTVVPDTDYPDYPANQAATAPAEGSKCKLTWDKVCSDLAGTFADCTYPDPSELMGYYVMRAQAGVGATDCTGVTVPDNPVTTTPTGSAPIDTSPNYTDTSVSNGTGYCYRVHAYDASNGFSRDNTPDPVFCMPMDTQAPDMPQMASSMDFTSISCSPAWAEVDDPDSLTYTVHVCSGEPADCTSSGFTAISEGTGISELSYDHIVDTSDTFYTYCVTAKDTAQNSSDVIDSSLSNAEGSQNCGVCYPSDKPNPPTNVQAGAYSVAPNYGINVWWTNSTSDDSSGNGYNVYLCTSSSGQVTGCTKIGDGVAGPKTSESPYEVSDAGISDGTYYAAVTYENSNGSESLPAFFTTGVAIVEKSVDPCDSDPVPSSCNISISVSGAFKRLSLTKDGDTYSSTETPLTSVEVLVVTDETDLSTAVAKKSVDTKGMISSFKIMESAISAGTTYDIVAKLPSGTFDGAYESACKNDVDTDGFCVIRLSRTSLEANSTVSAAAKVVPPSASSGGYGGEVGNPNGDGSVNLFDLAAIKNSMNTTSSDPCYKQWADFNLDGNINLFDLGILKDHMGEMFDVNDPDFDPALQQSKDPLPSECN